MVHDEFSVHEMDKSFFLAHTQAEIKNTGRNDIFPIILPITAAGKDPFANLTIG